jgi:hypothetical protein
MRAILAALESHLRDGRQGSRCSALFSLLGCTVAQHPLRAIFDNFRLLLLASLAASLSVGYDAFAIRVVRYAEVQRVISHWVPSVSDSATVLPYIILPLFSIIQPLITIVIVASTSLLETNTEARPPPCRW